jgi:putative copper resistance protein D
VALEVGAAPDGLPHGGTAAVDEPSTSGGPGRALAVTLLAALAALGVLVAAALLGGAADPTTIGDPGPVTRWGVLVFRTAYDVAAIGTLGVLLVVVVLLPRAGDGFGPDAARLVRTVSWWAAAWAATALATMLFTLSQVAGLPVSAVLAPDVLPLAMDLETTRSLISTAWLATLIAVGARVTQSPATGLLLLLGAVGAVVLPLLTGHAGHGELPAVMATSLALHVVAAAAWVGGLAALVVHLRRSQPALSAALPRFSRLALVCFVTVGASGALTGWSALVSPSDLWTSSYGQLLLGKVAALGVLALAGHRHRRRTVAAAIQRRPRAFVHLAAAELVLMACAAALAVALSHTAPPVDADHAAPAAATTVAVAAL